jgi:pimeloyl-ACP methyl ester carboxylesterase
MPAYRIIGTGPQTIVLLHGFCENSTCFNEQVLFLKEHYRVVCIDLPGFGNAGAVKAKSMEDMADYVYEAMVSIKLIKPVLFGHSMGGYVALALAKKYADTLSGVGLIHSTASADTEERIQKRKQAMAFIKGNGTEAYVKSFIPPLFHLQYVNHNRVEELINEAKKIPPDALISALEAMCSRPDSIAWLKETQLPVCFIAGSSDELIQASQLAEQATLCKRSAFYLLKSSAHMGMIEEAEQCSQYIADFCTTISKYQ